MHNRNLINAKRSMNEGTSPIVIDNTNIMPSDAKGYVKHALELGYDDKNIIIVDIGDAGLTADELAARNTHGVPVEKILKMMRRHRSVGPLTIKKIMESADMPIDNGILYSAVIIDEISHNMLLRIFSDTIPNGWKIYAHHMTIALGKPAKNEDLNKSVGLVVKKIGISDMAVALEVDGYPSENKIPHITLAVNPQGKPRMSNEIKDWRDIENLKVRGTITNIKK